MNENAITLWLKVVWKKKLEWLLSLEWRFDRALINQKRDEVKRRELVIYVAAQQLYGWAMDSNRSSFPSPRREIIFHALFA